MKTRPAIRGILEAETFIVAAMNEGVEDTPEYQTNSLSELFSAYTPEVSIETLTARFTELLGEDFWSCLDADDSEGFNAENRVPYGLYSYADGAVIAYRGDAGMGYSINFVFRRI